MFPSLSSLSYYSCIYHVSFDIDIIAIMLSPVYDSVIHFLISMFYTGNPENGLTYFWITDSCPITVRAVKNKPPFEVLSLAGTIAATLQI